MALSVCAPGVPVVLPFFVGVSVVPFTVSFSTSLTATALPLLPSCVQVPLTTLNR